MKFCRPLISLPQHTWDLARLDSRQSPGVMAQQGQNCLLLNVPGFPKWPPVSMCKVCTHPFCFNMSPYTAACAAGPDSGQTLCSLAGELVQLMALGRRYMDMPVTSETSVQSELLWTCPGEEIQGNSETVLVSMLCKGLSISAAYQLLSFCRHQDTRGI